MNEGERFFLTEASNINKLYNGLQVVEKNGQSIIAGKLDLVDERGNHHDTYSIEIHPVSDYPNRFPIVFEVGGRVPKNIDWHVFESDGHCCIRTLPEEIIACRIGINLIGFIKEEVEPYFYSQTFRRLNGYFLNERSHGFFGDIEFFGEVLDTNDILNMIKWLHFILQRKEPNRVAKKCFCGKDVMYRHCHRNAYRRLAKFSDEELRYFVARLYEISIKLYGKEAFHS